MSVTDDHRLASETEVAQEGITSHLETCERLASIAAQTSEHARRSSLLATLTCLKSALSALRGNLAAVQLQLGEEPARITLEMHGELCSLSLGAVRTLVHSIRRLDHDLVRALTALEMVLRIKGVRSGRDIGAGVERACTALQWQTAKACALFDHAADMPVEMNRVINGALHRAGLDPNVAVLPPDSAKGWVNGRLEIALGAFLRALDHSTRFEPGVGDMCVAAVLANDLEERKLVITVRAPTCQCSLHFAKLLSDAIGGTFEKHSQGPLFDVYAAGRMLLDCNAIIGMPDQRFDPVLLIHIPFPENIQSAG